MQMAAFFMFTVRALLRLFAISHRLSVKLKETIDHKVFSRL